MNLVKPITYYDINEVYKLTGFKEDEPISNENYLSIIGDYYVKEDVFCCLKKETGKLCLHPHRFGYVALTKAGSLTIVGNVCAKNKFGADSKIAKDSSSYDKHKKFLRSFETISNFIDREDNLRSELQNILSGLRDLKIYLDHLKKALGDKNYIILSAMHKSTNAIKITATKITRDDKGKELERFSTKHTIGSIKGVHIFDYSRLSKCMRLIYKVKDAFEKAKLIKYEFIEKDIKPKTKDFDELVSIINQVNQILSDGNFFISELKSFKENDKTLFCLLTSFNSDRIVAAKYLASEQRTPDNLTGKKYLNYLDNQLKNQFKTDLIRIG